MDLHLDRVTSLMLDMVWLLRIYNNPSLINGWTREETSTAITERTIALYLDMQLRLAEGTLTLTQHNTLVELWRCIEEEEAAQLDASL